MSELVTVGSCPCVEALRVRQAGYVPAPPHETPTSQFDYFCSQKDLNHHSTRYNHLNPLQVQIPQFCRLQDLRSRSEYRSLPRNPTSFDDLSE
jgi:hypothetical protein